MNDFIISEQKFSQFKFPIHLLRLAFANIVTGAWATCGKMRNDRSFTGTSCCFHILVRRTKNEVCYSVPRARLWNFQRVAKVTEDYMSSLLNEFDAQGTTPNHFFAFYVSSMYVSSMALYLFLVVSSISKQFCQRQEIAPCCWW